MDCFQPEIPTGLQSTTFAPGLTAKFCYSCGKELQNVPSSSAPNGTSSSTIPSASGHGTTKPLTRRPVSFEDFRKRKENDRSARFTPKNKGARIAKKEEDPEVTIQIGVMTWNEDSGSLSAKRGCNLPVKIKSSATAELLKAEAVMKQNRFNGGLVKVNNPLGYRLLYPDKTEVEPQLSWKYEAFTLGRYKDELGKPYPRITFYVATWTISATEMLVM